MNGQFQPDGPPTGAPAQGAFVPQTGTPQAPIPPQAYPAQGQPSYGQQAPAPGYAPQGAAQPPTPGQGTFAPGGPAIPPQAPAPSAPSYGQPTPATQSIPTPAPGGAPVPPQQPAPQAPVPSGAEVSRSAARAAQAGVGAPAAAPRPTAASGGRVGMNNEAREDDFDLNGALRRMLKLGGSDLHVTVGAPPMARVDGSLSPLEGFKTLDGEELQRVIYSILSQKQREDFEANLELDFAYALVGEARFRVNVYMQRDSVGAAFRVIPYEIKPLESLGIPPVVGNFAGLPRGLVLVTGPTGSGKSTTLASVIDLANRSRSDHIMTVEDPIEFLHRHKKSLVNQREVGADTHSFGAALKHVLRQDPDIILVGELRDLETISVALTAAETGHLVFGTLHTQDAAQTIDRIIDVFPAHQQGQVRTQLATALQGVVCQTLCRRADGPGRAVATEVMVATSAIRNLIREGKTHQIYSSMQAGQKQGMHTMDQHLADLVKAGKISYETGLEKCHHTEEFNRLSGRSGGSAQGAMTSSHAM